MRCSCNQNKLCGCKNAGGRFGARGRRPFCSNACRAATDCPPRKSCPRCEPIAEDDYKPKIARCEIEPEYESECESDIAACPPEPEDSPGDVECEAPPECEESDAEYERKLEPEVDYCAVPWVRDVSRQMRAHAFDGEDISDDMQDIAAPAQLTDELPQAPH